MVTINGQNFNGIKIKLTDLQRKAIERLGEKYLLAARIERSDVMYLEPITWSMMFDPEKLNEKD